MQVDIRPCRGGAPVTRCGRHALRVVATDRHQGTRARTKALPVTSEPTAPPTGASEAGPVQRVVADLRNLLLRNAASYLQRGPATCVDCKGTGACDCPACHGVGLLPPEQARMNMLAHSWQKAQGLLGAERAEYNTHWTMTNRCLKCHGTGHTECPTCHGLGVRGTPADRD